AWLPEPFGPGPHDELPGRWIGEPAWPSPHVATRRLALTAAGGLAEEPGAEAELPLRGLQTAGLESEWLFSGDQQAEDARALSFTSAPLPERLELLGN